MAGLLLAAMGATGAAMAMPMTYAEFQALPQPPAPRTIAYGADPLQRVELWKPAGKGPFPIVLMLHGGCWQTSVAKADIMHMLAADLVGRGIAVWNVEYRGVDVPGGGYPGTFQDVAAAADMLGREGAALGLDTRRIVAVGHSAGGHLALWLAGRHRIARTSVLWSRHPLSIAGVLSQGGLPDLEDARTKAAGACGVDTVDKLVGPPTANHPHVYADTSPVELAPLGVPQFLVSGGSDPISPPAFGTAYTLIASAKGDHPVAETVIGAGHFELITPTTDAWAYQRTLIDRLIAGAHPRPR